MQGREVIKVLSCILGSILSYISVAVASECGSGGIDVTGRSGCKIEFHRGSRVQVNLAQPFTGKYSMSFEFRTTDESGLVFFAENSKGTGIMALHFQNNRLLYKFRCGTSRGELSVLANEEKMRYNDGTWHKVVIVRDARSPSSDIITVDGVQPFENFFMRCDRYDTVFLGGLPIHNPPSESAGIHGRFKGCLRNFSVNRKPARGKVHYFAVTSCDASSDLASEKDYSIRLSDNKYRWRY